MYEIQSETGVIVYCCFFRGSHPKAMDGIVEENGTAGNPGGDPLAHSPGDTNTSVVVTSVQSSSSEQHHLVAATSIVQLTLPTHVNNSTATAQVQGCQNPGPLCLFFSPLCYNGKC